MWRYYFQFYRDSYRTLFVCIAASLIQSFLLLPIPIIVRYVFEDVVTQSDFRRLCLYGGLMLVLYVTEALMALRIRNAIHGITKDITQNLREELLKKIYSLSHTYYAHQERSKVHTVITQDTERLNAMSNALLAQFLPAILTATGLSFVLLILNPFLFLVTILSLPLLFWVSRFLNIRVRKATRSFHRSFELFSKGILFVLQNVTLTKVQSAEREELERQKQNLHNLKLDSGTMASLRSAHFAVQNIVAGLTMFIILVAGGIAVMKNWMTLADLLSFYVALALWKNALSSASQSVPHIIEGSESLKTLYEFLHSGDREPYFTGKNQIPFSGTISLKQVSFSYTGISFLRNIDLDLFPGHLYLLVGPNGAGKTTIANLILGFYRPQQGVLTADGIPYHELDLSHLRSSFGIVAQDPIPFHGTILENITYGNPGESSLEKAQDSARLAGAHDFIIRLPQGYNTFIGEEGILLSGGQRQLIAISRALLRKPPFLILDEPTKHLDQTSMRTLIRTLKNLRPAPALLIISHDAELVNAADRVYTLHEGTLIPAGAVHVIA